MGKHRLKTLSWFKSFSELLIVFYDMIAGMIGNKKFYLVVT